MEIKSTLDRVILRPEEVEKILRNHIEKETGRKVHGEVMFENNRAHMQPGVHAELAPKPATVTHSVGELSVTEITQPEPQPLRNYHA